MPGTIGAAAILAFTGTAVAATATAAVVVGNIILLGVSVGVQYLLAQRTAALGAVKPSSAQQEVKQPIPPRRKSYGRVRVTGPLWWYDTDPTELDVLRKGIILNHGRIAEIEEYFIDSTEVELSGNTVITDPWAGADDIRLYWRLGVVPETPYTDDVAGLLTSELRGDGVATLLALCDNFENADSQMQRYSSGPPLLRVTMKASVVWDPRDEAQDRETETTWEWSENPIVCLLDYMLSADGYGVPWERIEPNLDEWIAAMDVCDAAIDLADGGTESRYRIAAAFELTARPKDVVAQILSTCDGRVWQKRDGTLGVLAGAFSEPSITLGADAIVAYSLEHGQDRLTAIAGLRAEYMEPDRDYKEHEATPWPDGETVAALTEDRIESLNLLWVPSHGQARRLMKREFIKRTAAWRGTITTSMAGLRAIDERYINIEIPELGIEQSFEIGRFSFDPSSFTCSLDIASVGSEIDEWSAVPEEVASMADLPFEVRASGIVDDTTALDPLAVGGIAGYTAIVAVSVNDWDDIPAAPSGWTEITRGTVTVGGPFYTEGAVFQKLLDGTETSTTFLTGPGIISYLILSGAGTMTSSDVNSDAVNGTDITDRAKNAIDAPNIVIAVYTFQGDLTAAIDTNTSFHNSANDESSQDNEAAYILSSVLSQVLKWRVFAPGDEVIPFTIDCDMIHSARAVMLSFILSPGDF